MLGQRDLAQRAAQRLLDHCDQALPGLLGGAAGAAQRQVPTRRRVGVCQVAAERQQRAGGATGILRRLGGQIIERKICLNPRRQRQQRVARLGAELRFVGPQRMGDLRHIEAAQQRQAKHQALLARQRSQRRQQRRLIPTRPAAAPRSAAAGATAGARRAAQPPEPRS